MSQALRLLSGGRTARRALATGLLGATLAGGLAACGGGDDANAYKVRAIFDSASFVIPGLDVKIASVNVGEVTDVELTDDNRAAVTFTITDPGFQDFREDASSPSRARPARRRRASWRRSARASTPARTCSRWSRRACRSTPTSCSP